MAQLTPLPSTPTYSRDLHTIRAARLLADAGYLDDSISLMHGDPDLTAQILDPGFLEWLEIGAPGAGASSELVTLTARGANYETA
jgi:hypothetical protein